jgi:hypothetical protein
MSREKTISELLADRGYTHGRTAGSPNTGEHWIKDSYGNTIGHKTAHEAVKFLALSPLGMWAA